MRNRIGVGGGGGGGGGGGRSNNSIKRRRVAVGLVGLVDLVGRGRGRGLGLGGGGGGSNEVCTSSPPTPPAEIEVHATRAEFWATEKVPRVK
ncbi:hypothetical protein V493_03741 [Pseudogymnoascus sp. VKM F-4281 (FW-2241)]|nr:hypothetical protein V493_03741 [Pseudogymnoascus sp. VKM F-4281 (FW-2241)]